MTSSWFSLLEIIVLATALIVTIFVSWRVAVQTRNHFQLEHSRSFIERFNSAEMVSLRRLVDEWIGSGETPEALAIRVSAGDDGGKTTSAALRTFVNFFQELGVAYRHKAVKRSYTWDVFGALVSRYWRDLGTYISATRRRHGRPTLHSDFEELAAEMVRLDARRGIKGRGTASSEDPPTWIFGYGSLLNPNSIEQTMSEPFDRSRLELAWLNGYRRDWMVWDEVEFEYDPPRQVPLAYLALTPDPGARCNGVLFPVSFAELEAFDSRERNYRRVDVTGNLEASVKGAVYTYVGRAEYGEFPDGIRISQRYANILEEALSMWGQEFREDYDASTGDTSIELIQGEYHFVPEQPKPVHVGR